MSTYTKIKTLPLSLFNNAEYLSFMNHVLDLANGNSGGGDSESPDEISLLTGSDGIPELGLTKEFLDTYEADLLAMADVVDESRTSQETEQMALHDTNRDNLAIYIITRISRAGTLPLEAERDAGKYLYKVIKPYNGIARLPMAQETAKIKGLLLDLRKDENKPYVTTLGLDAYLAELEKENNAYDRLSQQRVQNRTTSKKESGANLRKRIDVYYDDLTLLAQSYGVAKPSEKATAFIAALNQLIAETTAAYNQRMASAKKPAPAPEPTRAYARRRLREPGRDLTVTSLPPDAEAGNKKRRKTIPLLFLFRIFAKEIPKTERYGDNDIIKDIRGNHPREIRRHLEEIHHLAGRQGEGTEEIRIGRGLGGREGRKDLSCGKHKGFDETNPRLMKYSINYTKKFKKNLRLCQKRGYDMNLFEQVSNLLETTGSLPSQYHPHKLSGKYAGLWECHIQGDWLLIWSQDDTELILLFTDTGTHSDLF
mgnify:CR=1 FL=1